MEKSKKILARRQWLRPVSSWGPNSSCCSTVELESYQTHNHNTGVKGPHKRRLEGTLDLSDCAHSVGYSFSASKDKHYKQQLAMMDKLIDELCLLKEAWVEGYGLVQERGGWKS